jgi:cytochrome c-type biogenesis protein CcmF
MTVLGQWVAVTAFLTAFASAIYYYRATASGAFLKRARFWLKISAVSVITASAILLWLLLRHDYSNGYVYSYSSTNLPLHFLLSSFYAGQEGSFLFWAFCSVVISYMLMKFTARRKSEPAVMTIFMGVQAFLLLLLIVKSPFYFVWEKVQGPSVNQVPLDGSGLNPLLQNFWMVLHPPVLFVGFAATAVPFSFAVAALWKRSYSLLVSQAFAWSVFASLVLGLGIMLGAYWAYGVLGWGGYWGWDPVENSSLIPWLTGVALVHTMIAQRRSGKYLKTNFALATVTFLLVIYSTFLTRSGILGDASVHAFVDSGAAVYWLLVGLQLSIALVGCGLLFARRAELKSENTEGTLFSRETLLGAGTLALVISAVLILVGTSYPIFFTASVEPGFYDKTNLPVAIAMLALIGFSLYTQWGMGDMKSLALRSLRALAVSAALLIPVYVVGGKDPVTLAVVFTALFALSVNIEMAYRIARINYREVGGKFAHIGIAIFFLGVIGSGKYSETQHVTLPLDSPQQALGYELTYTGYEPTSDGKFAFHVRAEKDGREFRLSPVMFDAGRQGIMRNPDIASFMTRDVYISPVSLNQSTARAGDAQGADTYTLRKGQAVSIGGIETKFVRFDMDPHGMESMMSAGSGMAIGSVLEISNGRERETVTPVAVYNGNGASSYRPMESKLMKANVQLVSMNVGMGSGESTVTVHVHREDHAATSEALVVEASVKPLIGLVWGGTVVMMVGFVISILKRSKE